MGRSWLVGRLVPLAAAAAAAAACHVTEARQRVTLPSPSLRDVPCRFVARGESPTPPAPAAPLARVTIAVGEEVTVGELVLTLVERFLERGGPFSPTHEGSFYPHLTVRHQSERGHVASWMDGDLEGWTLRIGRYRVTHVEGDGPFTLQVEQLGCAAEASVEMPSGDDELRLWLSPAGVETIHLGGDLQVSIAGGGEPVVTGPQGVRSGRVSQGTVAWCGFGETACARRDARLGPLSVRVLQVVPASDGLGSAVPHLLLSITRVDPPLAADPPRPLPTAPLEKGGSRAKSGR